MRRSKQENGGRHPWNCREKRCGDAGASHLHDASAAHDYRCENQPSARTSPRPAETARQRKTGICVDIGHRDVDPRDEERDKTQYEQQDEQAPSTAAGSQGQRLIFGWVGQVFVDRHTTAPRHLRKRDERNSADRTHGSLAAVEHLATEWARNEGHPSIIQRKPPGSANREAIQRRARAGALR